MVWCRLILSSMTTAPALILLRSRAARCANGTLDQFLCGPLTAPLATLRISSPGDILVETFTLYRGRGFTSATEARWAAFFDALGVEWEYGTGGLGLEKAGWCGGLFHLPRLNAWIEARPWPEGLRHGEFWPRHLAWAQGPDCRMLFPEFERLFVICGTPHVMASEPRKLREGADDGVVDGSRPLAYEAFANERPGYLWCECPRCGAVGIEMQGRVDLLCECYAHTGVPIKNPLSARLVDAYRQADEIGLLRGPAIPGRTPDDVPIQRWIN